MPTYLYKAINSRGRVSAGAMPAPDEAALEQKLKDSGLWLTESSIHVGDAGAAKLIDDGLRSLYKMLFITASPIPVKQALNLLGHDVGGLRLPLLSATPEETTVIAQELRRQGLLD